MTQVCLPTWVTQSPFVQESGVQVTFSDLPKHIQTVILYPDANPYELLKALSFFLYLEVPSFFLEFMTDVDTVMVMDADHRRRRRP